MIHNFAAIATTKTSHFPIANGSAVQENNITKSSKSSKYNHSTDNPTIKPHNIETLTLTSHTPDQNSLNTSHSPVEPSIQNATPPMNRQQYIRQFLGRSQRSHSPPQYPPPSHPTMENSDSQLNTTHHRCQARRAQQQQQQHSSRITNKVQTPNNQVTSQ